MRLSLQKLEKHEGDAAIYEGESEKTHLYSKAPSKNTTISITAEHDVRLTFAIMY